MSKVAEVGCCPDVEPMRLVRLLPLLLLGACATGPDRATVLNGLVGRSETELVQSLGVPSRSFETGGRRYLAYEEQHPSEVIGGGGFYGLGAGFGTGFYGGGVGAGFSSFPTQIVRYSCETTFEVADHRVLGWSLRGNACG